MKRVLLSAITLVLALNVFAISFKDKVGIRLKPSSGTATLIDGVAEGYDVSGCLSYGNYTELGDPGTKCWAYAVFQGERYKKLYLKNLTNIPLGVKTIGVTSYTFQFTPGLAYDEEVVIYDKQEDHYIHTKTETSYVFTVDASQTNSYIEDRFVLMYNEAVDFGVCFKENKLLIDSNPYGGSIEVRDLNGTEVLDSPYLPCTDQIDFSELDPGMYIVTFDGDKKYVVNKE